MGQGFITVETSLSHSDTAQSVGLLWTSDQPYAETSTWKHTTLTKDSHDPVEIRTRNPTRERPQTLALDLMATGIGHRSVWRWVPQSFHECSHFRRYTICKSIVSQVQCVQMIGIQEEKLASKPIRYTGCVTGKGLFWNGCYGAGRGGRGLGRGTINLLKTKRNLLYITNQFAPRSKHFPPRL